MKYLLLLLSLCLATQSFADTQPIALQGSAGHSVLACTTPDGLTCFTRNGTTLSTVSPEEFAKSAGYPKVHKLGVIIFESSKYISIEVSKDLK